MKEFQLSTPKERLMGISFSAAMIVCFGFLLFAVRHNTGLLIFCTLAALLLSVLLVFYVASILKSVCILDSEKKTLEVKGFPSYKRDLSKAVLVQTISRKNGQSRSRVLVFSDAEENIVAAVPTLFTYKQGILAEPMAREMAQYLGIEFKENVPQWEYDKEKFKEHVKEEEAAEKAARKDRMEQRRKKLLYRYRKK